MLENTILFAIVKGGVNKFIQTYINKDADIEGGMNIETFPAPLEDIRLLWSPKGYTNFYLKVNGQEKVITGDAGFFQYTNGEYVDLTPEAYRRICDAKNITITFNKEKF
ncbi:hypothetical protein J2T17_004348 [Paenibacillus mucilaginosus]|uniref:hypothetical protein n=1 Tax=Paenibacillus mucilaginosus TaxID=61624 RepID=UPI003D1A5109